jgi:hypothetical protein
MTDRKGNRKHLFYLDELSDFKVDSDDPDVRGWPVKDADNNVVGKVDNLLVNKEKRRVVYLDVEVDKSILDANHKPYGKPASGDVHEFINKEGENHLILPIGLARLNVDDKFVYTDRIDHRTFAETKRYEKGHDIDRDYEVVVLESYNRERDRDRDIHSDRDLEHRDRDQNLGTRDRDNNLEEERRRMKEGDRDRDSDSESNIAGRRETLVDDDRRTVDRERDAVTGNESGTHSDHRRSGNIPEDDSFYDRGEFDYTKYRR